MLKYLPKEKRRGQPTPEQTLAWTVASIVEIFMVIHFISDRADMRETPVRIICAASLLLMVWATWRFIRSLDFEAMRRR